MKKKNVRAFLESEPLTEIMKLLMETLRNLSLLSSQLGKQLSLLRKLTGYAGCVVYEEWEERVVTVIP